MPNLHISVKQAQEVWRSPDGQRVLYGIIMEVGGKEAKAKTYSKAIATIGWSGDIETYEKTGRDGVETFVKQVPKEGGFSPRPLKDEVPIKAMWSIGQA